MVSSGAAEALPVVTGTLTDALGANSLCLLQVWLRSPNRNYGGQQRTKFVCQSGVQGTGGTFKIQNDAFSAVVCKLHQQLLCGRGRGQKCIVQQNRHIRQDARRQTDRSLRCKSETGLNVACVWKIYTFFTFHRKKYRDRQ